MSKPLHLSDFDSDTDVTEAEEGVELLGLDLKPQGLLIAGVCNAVREDGRPRYRTVAIEVPRRSAKTTSTTGLALGRMKRRPGYRIISTAQTGDIARRMFRETLQALDVAYAGVEEDARPYRARIANGTESLTWENGSVWRPVTPSPLSYRSAAADLLIFEEGGHIPPDLAADLKAGAYPTLDTRPHGQVWVIGTPGPRREGMLWDALEAGRAGRSRTGIVEYALADGLDITKEDGTLDLDVLRTVHPGLSSGLTDDETMVERFESMPLLDFLAEYAGRWPSDNLTTALDLEVWEANRRPIADAVKPDRAALAFDVAPDDSRASLVLAWRDEEGRAHLMVADHREGSGWLTDASVRTSRDYGRAPVGHDVIGANQAVAESIGRSKGAPRLSPFGLRQMMGAAQVLAREVAAGRVVTYGQPALDNAAQGASWRDVRDSGRLFARKASKGDVSALVAASVALALYDSQPVRQPTVMAFAS